MDVLARVVLIVGAVLAAGLGVWIVIRRVIRLAGPSTTWPELAAALELEIRGTTMTGRRDGVEVAVVQGGENPTPETIGLWTEVRARIDPPLGLGLTLEPRRAGMKTAKDVRIGDDALDRALWVVARDADRARAMVLDPGVRALIAAPPARATGFAITDNGVRAMLPARAARHEVVGPALDWAVNLVHAVRRAVHGRQP